MFSEKDFERLWYLYKNEGEPKGVSINSFCISNNIPYTAFYDWFKKTQKKVVPVEVERLSLMNTQTYASTRSLKGIDRKKAVKGKHDDKDDLPQKEQ